MPNQQLASATAENRIRIWEPITGQLIKILDGHNQSINCLPALNNILVSGSDDMTIKIWATSNGSLLTSLLSSSEKKSLAFVLGNQLATGLWNIQEGKLIKILIQKFSL